MKKSLKVIALILCIAAVLGALSACSLDIITDTDTEPNTVTYVYGNGEKDRTVTVAANGKHTEPLKPTRTNYIFDGWYAENSDEEYVFGNKLRYDLTLYAKWIPDYEKITNSVTTTYMKANVKVSTAYYVSNMFGQRVPTGEGATGSGVIFLEASGYYYALTNYHVTDFPADAVGATYKTYDVYGNEHEAELLFSDAEYDLAVLRFKVAEQELCVLPLDKTVPEKGEKVIAIGQPKGQFNSLTYGEVYDYSEIASKTDDEELTRVTFEVIWHTAFLNNGSSGGGLLDFDMQLIGVNFASSVDGDNEFKYGFAIPAVRVLEFLKKCGFTYS